MSITRNTNIIDLEGEELPVGFEELEREQGLGLGLNLEGVQACELTPIQRSLQRVYGNTFTDFSSLQLQQHLRLEPVDTDPQQDNRSTLLSQFPSVSPSPSSSQALQHWHQVSSDPYLSNSDLPHPAQMSRTTRKTRTHLSNDNKIILLNLCVEYQAEHVHNKKMAFWILISELLEKETGVKLKDPQKTVNILVARRKAEVRTQSRESGTVQREDELSQKIDEWIKHENQLEQIAGEAGKTSSTLEREAEEAAAHRRNMLVRFGEKRNVVEVDSGEDEQEDLDEAMARKMKKMRKRKRRNDSKSSADTNSLVEAIEALGQGMVTAVRELVSSRAANVQPSHSALIDMRFQQLREEMVAERTSAAKAREEEQAVNVARNEELLARIFGKLEELKKN